MWLPCLVQSRHTDPHHTLVPTSILTSVAMGGNPFLDLQSNPILDMDYHLLPDPVTMEMLISDNKSSSHPTLRHMVMDLAVQARELSSIFPSPKLPSPSTLSPTALLTAI